MQQPSTRRSAITRNGVMAGSVWETRMKIDEVKGGIKVFNAAGASRDDEEGLRVYRRLRRNQSEGVDAEKKKRKSWKQPEPQRSPIQPSKARPIEIGCRKGVLLICDKEEGEKIDVQVEEQRRSFDDKEMDLPVEKEKKVAEQVPPPPLLVVEKKASYVEDLKDTDPDPAAMSQGEIFICSFTCTGEDEEEEEEAEEEEEILFESSSARSNKMQHIGWCLH